MQLDTSSPIDRTVNLLDDLLKVSACRFAYVATHAHGQAYMNAAVRAGLYAFHLSICMPYCMYTHQNLQDPFCL